MGCPTPFDKEKSTTENEWQNALTPGSWGKRSSWGTSCFVPEKEIMIKQAGVRSPMEQGGKLWKNPEPPCLTLRGGGDENFPHWWARQRSSQGVVKRWTGHRVPLRTGRGSPTAQYSKNWGGEKIGAQLLAAKKRVRSLTKPQRAIGSPPGGWGRQIPSAAGPLTKLMITGKAPREEEPEGPQGPKICGSFNTKRPFDSTTRKREGGEGSSNFWTAHAGDPCEGPKERPPGEAFDIKGCQRQRP